MLADAVAIAEALQRLEALFPGVAIAWASVGDDDLYEEERERADRECFTALRRAQYAAGRRAARLALARLGYAAAPITSDAHGVPRFPFGVRGSISHKHNFAVAAAIPAGQAIAAIGIDLEEDREPDEHALLTRVSTVEERKRLGLLYSDGTASPATWLHSVKEAVFKAAFAVDGIDRDYDEIEVEFSGAAGFTSGCLVQDLGKRILGVVSIEREALVSLAILGG